MSDLCYMRGSKEYPEPQPKHVYVVSVPYVDSMRMHVLAVFKTAHSLERFFNGCRVAQIRYQGQDRPINEVRGWYTVTERKVEG